MSDKRPSIAVIGSLNMDIVVEAERQPLMGETISGRSVSLLPGGKGANQAVAAARLGAHTWMIGAVGNDAFGRQIRTSLEQAGVTTDAIKTVDHTATGTASILIAKKDNCIVHVPGANAHCAPEDIDRNLSVIEKADIVLVQLEIPMVTVQYAVQQAAQLGKRVILNPAPATRLPEEVLRKITYLTPNLTELRTLLATEEGSEEELAERLLRQFSGHVVVTLGERGVFYTGADGRKGKVEGHRVKVVDTTGAGDAFNAGFAYALSSGHPLPEAVQFANATAAMSVTKYGAQNGMPALREVLAFIEQHN